MACIDRHTATNINPLISPVGQRDTLCQCAQLTQSLGLWVSQMEDVESVRPAHLVASMIAAAIRFELQG